MAYDAKLGEITDRDREYAIDLLADLAEACLESEPHRQQIVAEWLRKTRYEAVIADRKVR